LPNPYRRLMSVLADYSLPPDSSAGYRFDG
jgi:hypothetical protein